MVKAVGLLSAGLDSALALRLVSDQGVELVAVHVVLPFGRNKHDYPKLVAENLGVPLIRLGADEEYIELIRNPKYGYGSQINPCIDCRIYMLRQARRALAETGSSFVVTGDVLGQRPMTQHKRTLRLEEQEAGLEGLVLRPLSAKLLPPTIPEQKRWVKREALLGLKGKTRKPQLALAAELGIRGYRPPAGGCPLTHQEFAAKLRQLLDVRQRPTGGDIALLQVGRHFYHGPAQIVVGRDRRDNEALLRLKESDDCVLEVPQCGSPVTLVRGPKEDQALRFAATLTARYSDSETDEVTVECRDGEGTTTITVVRDEEPESRY